MKNNIVKFLLIISLFQLTPAQAGFFGLDTTFLDFEDLLVPFTKHHKQTVTIVNHEEAAIQILEAEVEDIGSGDFKELTGVLDTYTVHAKNSSNRTVLTYQLRWTLKHPFQNFIYKEINVNSIDRIHPGDKQKLIFRRDKHFRNDAYYFVEVSRIEYNNHEIWEAPEEEMTMSSWDKVKDEIDAIEETDVINGALMQAGNGVTLIKGSNGDAAEEASTEAKK